MADNTPIHITLYGEDDQVINEYDRTFIPWGILKQAIKLNEQIDVDHMDDAAVNALASLVVEAFGNKFSVADLDTGADVTEMVTVLRTIIAKAQISLPGAANPTQPGKTRRRR